MRNEREIGKEYRIRDKYGQWLLNIGMGKETTKANLIKLKDYKK